MNTVKIVYFALFDTVIGKEELKSEYYRWHGWDESTSLPTRQKLAELAMPDVADILESDGALA